MKILYLGYVWPEPASSAAGGRTLEIVRAFRHAGWQVLYASAAALSPHRFPLHDIGIEERSIQVNDDGFDELLISYQPDIVVFDRFFTEEQFGWRVERHCPQALKVLDTCDLHSLREARQLLLKTQLSHPHAIWQVPSRPQTIASMRSLDTTLRELAAIYRCDLSLLISDVEYDILLADFGLPSPILQVNRLLMTKDDSRGVPQYEERQNFISIGNFRHEPNWDAVLWLKQSIWPAIRALLPQAQLHVYGAYPPPKATQLHQAREGFHVLGWAEDAQAVMRQARVCLAPLRFGAGIKGKLADAMCAGTPSVTTSIGAEGMQLDLPWGGAIADTVEEFADAAVELYYNPEQWQDAQLKGQIIADRLFQARSDRDLLISTIQKLKENLTQHRAGNFVGAMLRHHSMKSSQYMSQWITLKNRIARENSDI
ncbi:glycosyltransferase [Undibacterium cyanobacteriorum]|uniref:Glycosyltransferase n=1 Tax=Undibacterium cyanobacteriorum TaxID=3073561 RepID=A0ABY9RJL2_9BURK|nr:glycosyltransferase [Undibacterium sp. 20NA77.5]WMW81019.1 glycosyltransferase [Undibacterium sp. 20NA77.5]